MLTVIDTIKLLTNGSWPSRVGVTQDIYSIFNAAFLRITINVADEGPSLSLFF